MAWYQHINPLRWFVNRKKAKTENEVRQSAVYQKLLGQYEESGRQLDAARLALDNVGIEYNEGRKVMDARMREKEIVISGLEERVGETVRESEHLHAKLTDKLWATKSLALRYHQKYLGSLERLKNAIKDYEWLSSSFDTQVDDREQAIRVEYMSGLRAMADRNDQLMKDVLSGYGYEVGTIIVNREKELGLSKSAMVFVNYDYRPICATQGFRRLFDLSLSARLEDVPLMEETIEQVKQGLNRRPFCIQFKDGKVESKTDIEIMCARGNSGEFLGAFVFYTPKDERWFRRMAHLDLGSGNARARKAVSDIFLNGLTGGEANPA